MDLHVTDAQLVSAVLVAATHLLVRAAGWWRPRRGHHGRSALAEIIPVLPAGSRAAELQPDGTVVRVDLPGQPMTSPER
jgi:hypothetical protein